MPSLRARIHALLDADDAGISKLERLVDTGLLFLVLVNALAVVLESVPRLRLAYKPYFTVIELVSVYLFTLEYVLRLWSAVENRRYHTNLGRLRFALTPFALIDLFSILPFYLALGGLDLRILRLVRLFRLFKITRYVRALGLIQQVIRRKRAELAITVGMIAVLLILVSSLMYSIENEAQPDKFGSIPETMWWGVATLTTVGYGDVFPITPLGKVLSGLIAVLGLGLFALPTGILAAGFAEQLSEQHARDERHYCSHCGHKL